MYSGDETGGLVADYGSHTSKFGFAGEDCPRIVRRTQRDFRGEFSSGISELCTSIDVSDHPIIVTVPALLTEKERIARTSEAFEVGAPAVFLLRSPVAAAFASGKSTALIVEIGASAATVCPVFEGHALLKCVRRSESLGGKALTESLATALTPQLAPPSGKNVAPIKMSQYWDRIDDIKHSCCQVWRTPPFHVASVPADASRTEYSLPDGKIVKLGGPTRFELCEPLFHPSTGLGALVYDAIAACEPDLRRTYTQDIVVVGGASLLDGLTERLSADLAERLPVSFKPRVQTPGTTIERRFAPFVGGSVLASLGSFQQMWLSRKEWDEVGERGVIERFVQ